MVVSLIVEKRRFRSGWRSTAGVRRRASQARFRADQVIGRTLAPVPPEPIGGGRGSLQPAGSGRRGQRTGGGQTCGRRLGARAPADLGRTGRARRNRRSTSVGGRFDAADGGDDGGGGGAVRERVG